MGPFSLNIVIPLKLPQSMKSHAESSVRRTLMFLAIASILCVVYFIYSFGFGGIFFFDDPAVFDGLTMVTDTNSALLYVWSGDAGPLGRPVAMATFLIHASSYPGDAKPFFVTNALLHLCNIVLLAAILRKLQRLREHLFPQSTWFPVCVAALWGILPILASTSMMAVQRMTSLSGFFVLVGVAIYLWGKQREHHFPTLLIALVGVGICTLLAAFSKENGILLPIYLLVLNLVLSQGDGRGGCASFSPLMASIVVPSLVIIGYIAFRLLTISDTYVGRPFDLWGRLATQSVILWEYLRVSFAPNVMDLSPFRDDYRIYRFWDTAVVFAVSGWAVVVGLAVVLRRTQPMLILALAWYLGGHLLESTIFPLHLYFEHRNYVPIIGPVIAAVSILFQMPGKVLVKSTAGACYMIFLSLILWQTVAIWGNREQLVWAYQHPGSPRAVQTIAGAYLQAGQVSEASKLYDRTSARYPRMTSAAIQGLRLSCYEESDAVALRRLAAMQTALVDSDYSALSLQSLEAIRQLYVQGLCPHLKSDDLHAIVDLLSANPAFQSKDALHMLHFIKGELYADEGRNDAAIDEFERALAFQVSLKTVVVLARILREHRGEVSAHQFLDEMKSAVPLRNPWKRAYWHQVIERLR